jgi:Family of unknown function (DUF5681)
VADATNDNEYQVGYKHPPKQTQFPPGTSGNPAGRPKGSRNLHSIVREAGKRIVKVNGPAGQREVSLTEAVVMQMANSAAQGDHRAQRQFLNLVAVSEQVEDEGADETVLHVSDRAVMASMLKRMRDTNPTTEAETVENPGGDDE